MMSLELCNLIIAFTVSISFFISATLASLSDTEKCFIKFRLWAPFDPDVDIIVVSWCYGWPVRSPDDKKQFNVFIQNISPFLIG